MKPVKLSLFLPLIVRSIMAMQVGCAQERADSRAPVAVKACVPASHSAADVRSDDSLIGNF
jgi:hypothetical protein